MFKKFSIFIVDSHVTAYNEEQTQEKIIETSHYSY